MRRKSGSVLYHEGLHIHTFGLRHTCFFAFDAHALLVAHSYCNEVDWDFPIVDDSQLSIRRTNSS